MHVFLLVFLMLAQSQSAPTNPFSDAQMASLAAEVLRQTPEYTHFAPGAHFKWVLFVPPSPDPYPEVTKTLRTALKKKYSLYDKRADLPASSIEKTPAGEGYVGGFQFTVTIKQLDKDKIEVQYNDFENPIAAGDQTIRYQWIKGAWKEIWRSAMAVS